MKGRCKKDRGRLFSEFNNDRTKANGQKLKYKKCHLNMRKKLFYCEGGQSLEEVLQRDCGVFILEDSQYVTGHGPKQLVLVALAKAGGLN